MPCSPRLNSASPGRLARRVASGLITAGPQSPVQFARVTMAHLGLASERTLDAYEALFHDGDTSAFGVLMAGGQRAPS